MIVDRGVQITMPRPRLASVAILSTALAVLACLWASRHLDQRDPGRDAIEKAMQLEAKARARFEAFSGLARCGSGHSRWLESARVSLRRAGNSSPGLLVVAAPTFSDIHILVVRPFATERYRVPGVTAFGPDFIDSPGQRAEALPNFEFGTSNQLRLVSALQRNIRHAAGNPAPGLDGTNYYFSYDDDHCAVVWSPDQGVAKELATLVDELTLTKPSLEIVEAGLDRLERIESAH